MAKGRAAGLGDLHEDDTRVGIKQRVDILQDEIIFSLMEDRMKNVLYLFKVA